MLKFNIGKFSIYMKKYKKEHKGNLTSNCVCRSGKARQFKGFRLQKSDITFFSDYI